MMDSAQIVQNAWRAGLAAPAFNIPYLPMMDAVVRALVDTDSFGLVAVARLEFHKFEAQSLAAVRQTYRKFDGCPNVRLHLDHLPVIDEDYQRIDFAAEIREAVNLGYESVMVDGSRLSLDENIAATRQAVVLAHEGGVPCEAELGAVMGHGSGPLPPYDELFESGKGFTDPDEAARFVAESGCDWLSVAVGSIHGAIAPGVKDRKKLAARLDLAHLERLRDATGIPLVLHGGTGIPRDYILGAIQRGIAKINVATEIRQPYERALRETGEVEQARQAVYERTVWVMKEHFALAGTHKTLVGE